MNENSGYLWRSLRLITGASSSTEDVCLSFDLSHKRIYPEKMY